MTIQIPDEWMDELKKLAEQDFRMVDNFILKVLFDYVHAKDPSFVPVPVHHAETPKPAVSVPKPAPASVRVVNKSELQNPVKKPPFGERFSVRMEKAEKLMGFLKGMTQEQKNEYIPGIAKQVGIEPEQLEPAMKFYLIAKSGNPDFRAIMVKVDNGNCSVEDAISMTEPEESSEDAVSDDEEKTEDNAIEDDVAPDDVTEDEKEKVEEVEEVVEAPDVVEEEKEEVVVKKPNFFSHSSSSLHGVPEERSRISVDSAKEEEQSDEQPAEENGRIDDPTTDEPGEVADEEDSSDASSDEPENTPVKIDDTFEQLISGKLDTDQIEELLKSFK
jgi:hypothetical protein